MKDSTQRTVSVKEADPTILAVEAIRHAAILVARDEDDREPPLRGRCVEVTLAVRAVLGGEILGEFVPCPCEPECAGTNHYWNLLPGGDTYDLTSDQFGGDGMSAHFTRGEVQSVPLARTFEVIGFVGKVLDMLAVSLEPL